MKKMIFIFAVATAMAANAGMCKFPGCKDVAIEKSQFCERHTCDTEGCYAGVKVGGIPGWVQGNTKANAYGYGAGGGEIASRIVWRHCPKHCCARLCPRLANPSVRSLIAGKSEDEVLELLACGQERLQKGKYCLKHSCAVSSCQQPGLEAWNKRSRNKESTPEWSDLEKQEFCPQHLSKKGNNKLVRDGLTKETCSECVKRKREEARKAAEKAAGKSTEEK